MTLEHLDTVIGFVVILSGVSLLVTTLIQMVSVLFGLRGRWRENVWSAISSVEQLS